MHELGQGVDTDYALAAFWYEKAADQNLAIAQNDLAGFYAEGKGVAQDSERAIYWYRRAASLGDKRAQYNLGVAYLEGEGVPANRQYAVDLFRESAKQGFYKATQKLDQLKEPLHAKVLEKMVRIYFDEFDLDNHQLL